MVQKVSGPAVVLDTAAGLANSPCRSSRGRYLWSGSAPLIPPIVLLMASGKPVRNAQNEYERFSNLLDRLLAIPHSKLKTALDAEKQKKPSEKIRAERGHAYRDRD